MLLTKRGWLSQMMVLIKEQSYWQSHMGLVAVLPKAPVVGVLRRMSVRRMLVLIFAPPVCLLRRGPSGMQLLHSRERHDHTCGLQLGCSSSCIKLDEPGMQH